ncbi:LOW QUALITY PROTEIN: dynein axonemal heavy chain 14 [Sceloporus undulatus]|uniref:LOW QUALITY PROTEIN: dynein axonemal heavy chain 14 n=1 Tax=Sceloporus undulatus TaxID=8520 RepID=UPI001C4CA734|nr:LOW QUALITY PROTEIN: dynein axonemal heavy chain 14 [Sceloporus undulatus]
MDEKIRQQQKRLASRLQLRPEDTDVPHMVKGKFIKLEQTSRTAEDEYPPLFPGEISPDLRTAVYRTDTARKCKTKNKEGKMAFDYVFSRIQKGRTKPVVEQATEVTEWDQCRSLEYSHLKNESREKLSVTPFHEYSSCTTGASSFVENEDQEETEVQTVSKQLSCHRRTCMKFQAGYDHKFVRGRKSPSYDKTEPLIDDVISHILRLRDKLGWQTSLPRYGCIAKPTDKRYVQKITLSMDSLQKDDGEYVYCLIRSRDDPRAVYDPYDLQVVSANLARQSKEYWTVTASYISQFTLTCGKQVTQIIPVMEWLYERQLYYALRAIKICFNFRKIKYFIGWKSNVKRSKINKTKMVMYKQLFFADEILQRCLLYIQTLCVDVSSPQGNIASQDVAIHFIKIDTSYTYTLDEFCEKQYQQGQQALSQVQAFKDKVIKVIQSSFLKVAQMEGAEKLFQHFPDDFKEKPKHFEIAGWRHIMERFSRFLQLIDRIFQELLRRLIHNAINLLLEIFKASSTMITPKKKMNESLIRSFKRTIERGDDLTVGENRCLWMYQDNSFQGLQESSHHSKKHETKREIITISDIDKILEEVKRELKGEEEYSSTFEVNICLRIPYEKDYYGKYQNDDDDLPETPLEPVKEKLEHGENFTTVYQCDSKSKCEIQTERTTSQELNASSSEELMKSRGQESFSESNNVPIIYESSPLFCTDVCLIPNRREFSVQLQGILDGLENIIDQIEPFSQDPQLSIFVVQSLHKVMQSYETYVGPEPEQYFAAWPHCDLILGTDPDYENKILSLLSLQSCSLGQVECYCRNFMEFCNMVDKAKNTTDKISALRREMSTDEFRNILENYTIDIKEIVCMVVERRISMFNVKSCNYQKDCLPYFEALLNKIHLCFYAAMEAKNAHLVEVTKTAVAKLSKELITVDGFIEHLLYLQEITTKLPKIKMQCDNLSELYFIANDYDIFLPLQQLALYQTVVRTLQSLQSTVLICEKMKDDYIIKFSEGLVEYIDNLQAEMREYKNKVRNPVLLLSETLPKTAKEMIESLIEEAAEISEKILNYANYQTVLDSSVSDMKSLSLEKLSHRGQSGDLQRVNAELAEIESELTLRKLLWDSQEEWAKLFARWKYTIFWFLDVDLIQKDVNRFIQITHILEKGLPENTILPTLKKSLMDFKEFLPIIIALRNPSLQPRHWETIQNIVGQSLCLDKRLTLDKILELNMFRCKKEITEVSITATNETTLEVMMKKIIGLWYKTDFHLSQYHTEASAISIISSAEDIIALLEDSQVTISTIKGSCFVGPIKTLVDTWGRKLNLFSCTLEEWLTCQRNWIYLEPIFQAPEIKRQLPEEASLFSQVDNKWREIMKRTEEHPNALKAATAVGVFEMMQSNNACLEKIQKALEDYLEVKRMVFPRFYFLSSAELLDILAESKNPDAVQPHLVKCFANIRKLYIRPQEQRPPVILMIRSAEGEILLLPKSVRIRGPVEQWLGTVESTMYDMVRKFITVGISEWDQMEFKEWFFTHPGQVVLLVSQIMFTQECEECLLSSNPKKEMISGRDDLINLTEQLSEIASDVLPYHKESTLEALVTLFIHCREVLTTLIDDEIQHIEDFEWTRQLHYQWHEAYPCRVIQGYASFEYGYEYLGCSPRLVITPLTDRCWLTVTGALHLNLGGCLAGPAGTGKSETVKDLSKALGKLCLSFNCSEGLDDKVMGKLFCGLVQSGAWCCFDEFNRIDIEVLSAVASQIQTIKAAKDSFTVRFVLEGKEIRLKPFCAFFITLNPGYKGRVELPDNLKSLFRPISMMVPDYELIAEIMLFSEGFKSAKLLSGKIVDLYHLSNKQLSQQDHYDFGMRAIKTVLIRAGQKIQEFKIHNKKKRISAMEESLIIISVLKEVNLPKFLADDAALFEDIITDLFPGMKVPKINPKRLETAISLAIQHLRLQPWESQIEKIIQFYNQILARVGVMLVGPTGGGKTTIRTILEKALMILPLVDTESSTKLDVLQNSSKRGKIDTFVINPKCVTLGELFGETNPSTMEWSDGLLSSAVRSFAKLAVRKPKKKDTNPCRNSEMLDLYTLNTVNISDAVLTDETLQSTENINCETITDWQWIILDGPVDPIWIENLNSVLDDTRMLCLANSERIYLSPAIRMIFEVDNLSQASPATVSRCAMVYVDPTDLGWKPYVKTWLEGFSKTIAENDIEYLESLFDCSLQKGLDFLNEHKKMQAFPVQQMGVVMNICRIVGSFIHIITQSEELQCSSKTTQSTVSFSTVIQDNAPPFSNKATSLSGIVPSIMKKKESARWFWEKQPNKLLVLLGKLFIFAFTWAVGGILRREEEHEGETLIGINTSHDDLANVTRDFNYLVHNIFETKPPANIQIPSGDKTVFDYFVDLQTGEFEPWGNLVPSTQLLIQKETSDLSDSDNKMTENQEKKTETSTFVPNIDTIRHSFLTSLLLLNKHPVLIIGDPGTGKTDMIDYMLGRLQKEGGLSMKMGTILGEVFYYGEIQKTSSFRSDTFHSSRKTTRNSTKDFFSALNLVLAREEPDLEGPSSESTRSTIISKLQLGARTSAAQTKGWILQKLILKSKDILGAPHSKQVLLFIDDLNMPIPEEYGSQPPLELIRQFLDLGGFYDTRHLEWKHIQDVSLVACCTPPSEGSNDISARLLTHFCTLLLPATSLQSLQRIFQVRLGTYFYNNRFMVEVQKCKDYLTCSSIALYYRMFHKMRPTPAKCHYTFNLRDLFKVLEGLLQAHRSVIVSKETTALFFVHEAARVFHDRLIDSSEKEIFYHFLSNELNNYFKISWTKEKLMEDSPIFVDFLDLNAPVEKRIYRNITNQKRLLLTLEDCYMRMQAMKPESASIVFFKEAVQHITRAARIFRQEGGHMTLIGLDGNGKVTCASLACYLSDCSLYRLSITCNYNSVNFREDLKKVYKQAGLEGKRIVFLIRDSEIIQETFLEDLSCILKSGQVPNLFEKDELDNIIIALTSAAEKVEHSNSIEDIYSFFLQRVHSNLHVVLTISPAGMVFRQRCRTYPAIVNCCTIDWYEDWPEEALCHVAKHYFSYDDTYGNENFRNLLVDVSVNIHKNVSVIIEKYLKETKRHYYVTPNGYLHFIKTFSTILQSTKEKTVRDRTCYHSGLTKILEATSHITDMQDELFLLGPQIEKKSQEIEELVEKLHKDAKVVEQVRTIVKQDEENMAAETRIVEEYAKQATDELNVVLPSLEKALNALDSLDKTHIAELRVYTRPPPLVLTVMNAVCILLQKKPNWTTAKLLLADPGFLKKLVTLDKDNLPEKVFMHLKKYIKSPDFNPVKVGLVSVACCSMCQWILALDHYHNVKKFVDPKQAKVAEAEELLKRAMKKMEEKQRSLALIEQHQQNLEARYGESIAEQEKLAARKDQTTRRLHSASILSTALKDEMERWKESVNNFDQRLQGIMGDAFVSAACVVYSGVLSAGYRQQLVDECLRLCCESNIPVSPYYSLVNCMAEKNEVRKWQNAGLPLDQYSTENAILVKYGQRWPLLIDPERQAYKWIHEMAGDKLQEICATDASYLRKLENCMRIGESVLLQDLTETLDSNIKSILKKEIFNKGGQDFIRIGDSKIEYNKNFRLYMTTRKANPHFLPAICNAVTMINFTVTFQGLQDQLLSAVVIKEKPELEQKRCELLESISTDLVTLRELEEKSLILLQKTDGHLLDDQDLIDNLQRTKVTSTEIFDRVEASAATEATIQTLRESYLPIANRGAVLYFVVLDLVHINYMYQFSLEWFRKIFADSIDDIARQKSEDFLSASSSSRIFKRHSRHFTKDICEETQSQTDYFKIHVNDIIEKLTSNVFKTVTSALFSENQLCFAFLLCTAIMKNNSDENQFNNNLGFIQENEWNFFLHSSIMANMDTQDTGNIGPYTCITSPPLHWITEIMWKECLYMSTHMPAFSQLCDSLLSNSQQWRAFLNSQNVYYLISTHYRPVPLQQESQLEMLRDDQDKAPLIFPWHKLSSFGRLILIKVLRLESLNSAVREFVIEKLGSRYIWTGVINLKSVYEESDSTTPIILIHTHGVDIAAVLLRLAQEIKGNTQHVKMISLGRGQGSKAEELVYKSQILKGQWAFLQNCHLAASFMPRLCTIFDSLDQAHTDIDPEFRLWLSSTPDNSIPVSILRKSLKIVIEAPQGLKGTLLQTFGLGGTGLVTEAIFNKINCGPSWKTLLFSLCFFNAVVHERKKYGALGWNIPYDFSSSDLEISIHILEMLLEKQSEIPWAALHYLTGEVVYGGRVTDHWDRRCLLSILDNFYNPSVLQEDFAYSVDWVYRPISETDTLKDCRTYLRSLPEADSPELFGMHHCAEKVYLKTQAQLFVESVVSTQPAISTGTIISGGRNQDEIILEIAADILIRLPLTVEDLGQAPDTDDEVTKKITFRNFKLGPVWATLVKAAEGPCSFTSSTLLTVLQQEIDHYNTLLSIIIQSLHTLQQGIKGDIIFTTGLEELYNSILKAKVPKLWQQHSYESYKPLGSWIDDLIIRLNFFAMWANRVITFMKSRFNHLAMLQRQTKTMLQTGEETDFSNNYKGHPNCFWLPGFFFPHGFLTAVLQNYARQNEIPVDTLTFVHKVLAFTEDEEQNLRNFKRKETILNKAFTDPSPCETGIRIYGLYIDGACWSPITKSLEEPELHERFYALPDVLFLPEKVELNSRCHSLEEETDMLHYECPLYRTPQRLGMLSSTGVSTNFVTAVNLPSLVAPSHWITRGVALLCQLDD